MEQGLAATYAGNPNVGAGHYYAGDQRTSGKKGAKMACKKKKKK